MYVEMSPCTTPKRIIDRGMSRASTVEETIAFRTGAEQDQDANSEYRYSPCTTGFLDSSEFKDVENLLFLA